MSKRFLCLLVLLTFCSPLWSDEVADTVVVTATTAPSTKIIVPVSTQNPLKENWAGISATGSYTGQPAHNNTEEITGSSKWQASASCNGVIFKNNQSSFNWQGGFTFNFSVKSNLAAKYTISITLSVRIAIHQKKADGTAGDFLRWSPAKSVTVSRDFWIVGIADVKVKPADSPDSAYISAPSEVVALVGAKHRFKAIRSPSIATGEPEPYWPSGKPKWTYESEILTGETIEKEADSSGSTNLMCECGNIKTLTWTKVQPEVVSVDFRGDGVQTIYDVGTTPEWVKNPSKNEPFCAIKNKNINYYAKFSANKNLTFLTPVKVCTIENMTQCTKYNMAKLAKF